MLTTRRTVAEGVRMCVGAAHLRVKRRVTVHLGIDLHPQGLVAQDCKGVAPLERRGV